MSIRILLTFRFKNETDCRANDIPFQNAMQGVDGRSQNIYTYQYYAIYFLQTKNMLYYIKINN